MVNYSSVINVLGGVAGMRLFGARGGMACPLRRFLQITRALVPRGAQLAHRVCARTGIHCGKRRGQGRIKTVPEWRNWQTRQVQDLVLAREWRFESSFGHHANQSKGSPNPPASLICSASSSFLPSFIWSPVQLSPHCVTLLFFLWRYVAR
jgi:hypothetical protein